MRPLPKNQLDPKVKSVWRISDALWLTLAYAVCSATFFIIALVDPESSWAWIVVAAMTVAWVVALVVMVGILPPIRHMRWRYEVGENELDIARGIIWRARFVIPFVRVQNTDTKQGFQGAGLREGSSRPIHQGDILPDSQGRLSQVDAPLQQFRNGDGLGYRSHGEGWLRRYD